MILLYMVLSAACAFGLVFLFEMGWLNRPPTAGTQWPKGRAMRFVWAGTGIVAFVGQSPLGILLVIAGLPVCLAHLALVDRQPAARIRVGDVFWTICQTARTSFRRFMDRSRIGAGR